ncbi:LysR family transcriptional regulator [Mesorhizobium sp. ZC-5]|jgi:DNA-binding transcriptional LysR family regulator|uniref:LysR family transcriptional regulator n=1 Tax=Mesorhizobium sp. ZC-5 TaxID=2986066 RepID=UPI0021E96E10|nr:LysR family transcriptional regulator [Mesorhizobium sp. ZC-5]MCV3242405.1 LysR family transcriptional regulator [Mesorhizobium sp. ZC-5]
MELKQLEAFLAVFSAGSITAAARLLDRSQPAVSRLIQELESDIGFELLHRNGPRITPTERGIRFHEEAERLLTGIGRLHERARAIATEEAVPIEIVAIPAFAAGFVPKALTSMPQHALPSRLHVRSAPAESGIQSVLARTADLCVVSLPAEQPGLETHLLAQAPCVVALATSDPLARKDVIAITDLEGRSLITMANPFRLRRRVDQAIEAHSVNAARVIDTNAAVVAMQLTACGAGVAIIEPVTAYGVSLKGVEIRPLDVDIPFLWGVFSAVSRPLPETARAFIDQFIKTTVSAIPGLVQHDPRRTDLVTEAIFGGTRHRAGVT